MRNPSPGNRPRSVDRAHLTQHYDHTELPAGGVHAGYRRYSASLNVSMAPAKAKAGSPEAKAKGSVGKLLDSKDLRHACVSCRVSVYWEGEDQFFRVRLSPPLY